MRKLVNFRKKYNLTQKEISNKLGVSQSTVSSWELNKSTPNREFNSNIDRMIRRYKQESEEQEMNNVNVNLNMSKKFKIKMYILFICLLEKIFKSIRISSYFNYMRMV